MLTIRPIVNLWKQKGNTMKQLLKTLFFDREMVAAIKAARPSKEQLYAALISGRITLKEYIAATRK
jgi:hypothetical protein